MTHLPTRRATSLTYELYYTKMTSVLSCGECIPRRRRTADTSASNEKTGAPAATIHPPPGWEPADHPYTCSVAVLATMVAQTARLAEELQAGFDQHPDAVVLRALPGLGTILGARVLGEFGDEPEPNRYATAKSRKNAALRHLGNRLVGILHGCLASHTVYSEKIAWGHRAELELTRAA